MIEADTGQGALDLVRTARPQIVLLDASLPDMTGLDVCRLIRDDPETQSTLVVHLTATSAGLEDELTGPIGGDSYLTEPVEPQEAVAHLLALLRLKRTEEALRDANVTLEVLVSSSPLAVITLDCNGVVQRWNPAAERLFGWTAAEAIGQPSPLAPAELRHEFEHHLQVTLSGRPQTGIETIRMRKDGQRVPVSLSVAPLHDKRGHVVGALALIEDISARRQAEAELARLYAESQQAARAKDEFLAMLSHELRTPFNAMLLWIQMLRRGTVGPERVDYALEVIERNAMAQLRLIEDILDVSSIISGKLRLQLLAGTTLLIVDDHDDARDVLRQLLVLHGATVHSAASAEEAVRLVLSEHPSVLVADIGMPGEDGLSMIARLRGASRRSAALCDCSQRIRQH